MSNFLEIATGMAKRGVAVTPTYPRLRHPAMPGWNGSEGEWYAATTDLKQIEAWARENPNFNCCSVSKSGGAFMLDIDDLAASKRRGMPDLPQTFTVKTPGGGLHVYFNHTAISRSLGNCNIVEVDGEGKTKTILEVKGHNLACCAPGCTRDDGGEYLTVDAAPLDRMPTDLWEWLLKEAEKVRPAPASKAGQARKFHDDFERADLHEHFEWEFASDEPFVQRDGAEYYTFLTCPVCDRELDADDIKSRRCCLIYGNYGVSFNCVWCGDAVRWPELMAAMEAKGTAEYPYFIYENDAPLESLPSYKLLEGADDPPVPEVNPVTAFFAESYEGLPVAAAKDKCPAGPGMGCLCGGQHVYPQAKVDAPVAKTAASLVAQLIALMLNDPGPIFTQFVFYRKQLWEWRGQISDDGLQKLLCNILLYERKFTKLPTLAELQSELAKAPLEEKEAVAGALKGLQAPNPGLTVDYLAQTFIRKARSRFTQINVKACFEELQGDDDVDKFYAKLRLKQSTSSLVTNLVEGSFEERVAEIRASFNPITSIAAKFRPSFKSIAEEWTGADRFIFTYGLSSSYKSCLNFTLAIDCLQQGISVLWVAGEHARDVVERRFYGLYAAQHREQFGFTLASETTYLQNKASPKDWENLNIIENDVKTQTRWPGALEVKRIEDFHNDWDEVTAYVERQKQKYNFGAVFIDPFDCLVANSKPEEEYKDAGKVLAKALAWTQSYNDGAGILVFATFQVNQKMVAPALAKVVNSVDKREDIDEFDAVLKSAPIHMFTNVRQRADLGIGVAYQGNKGQGVVVCGRVRNGAEFESFFVKVDPISQMMHDVGVADTAAAAQAATNAAAKAWQAKEEEKERRKRFKATIKDGVL